jgi:hypothetical protein
MSYKCEICGDVVPSKIRAMRLAKTRVKNYPYRPKANPGFQMKNGQVLRPLRKSRKRSDRIDDPGGRGIELVKEVFVCRSCMAR